MLQRHKVVHAMGHHAIRMIHYGNHFDCQKKPQFNPKTRHDSYQVGTHGSASHAPAGHWLAGFWLASARSIVKSWAGQERE